MNNFNFARAPERRAAPSRAQTPLGGRVVYSPPGGLT
jgi:hypothetical protein